MQKKAKVAIVVLNYLNDADTVECVQSIRELEGGPYDVVVVDNGSPDDVYARLQQHFEAEPRITLLRSPKNVGFARGNNLGITYAKKTQKADFVLVVNNDTILTDPGYITKLLEAYEPGVGILGSKILLPGNKEQNRFGEYLDWKNCFVNFVNFRSRLDGACFDFELDKSKRIKMLNGCSLLFTPDFFRHYKGFFEKTFLYYEETILYLMCMRHGLRQKYLETTEIFHKESQASEISFSDLSRARAQYYAQSYKWVLWWRLKVQLLGKMHCEIE